MTSSPSAGWVHRPWASRAWPWMAKEPGMAGSTPHRHPKRTVANLVTGLGERPSTSTQCGEDLTSLCNIATGQEVDDDGTLGCKQRMAELGVIEGVVDVLWAQLSCASVQEKGFTLLYHLAVGDDSTDDDVEARKLRMVEAAVLETITTGMRLHVSSVSVELLGLSLMSTIATVSGEEANAYGMRRLEAAGAIEATVVALQAHTTSAELHERGFGVLCDMSSGEDDVIADRLQRMAEEVFTCPPNQSCPASSSPKPFITSERTPCPCPVSLSMSAPPLFTFEVHGAACAPLACPHRG